MKERQINIDGLIDLFSDLSTTSDAVTVPIALAGLISCDRRVRLSRWRDLDPRPAVVRYEHPHPGDLLHLDIKGMTRFGEVAVRGDGRLRGRQEHPGLLALHVAVDDHSRVAFTRILPDQKSETTIGFLREAVNFFAQRNVQVRALLSDNGSCYRSHLPDLQQMQMTHRRTRPYTPRTNKAECFIQTDLRECAYATHWDNSDHSSMKLRPPIGRPSNGTVSRTRSQPSDS
jgi:transposase InsO family protein